MSLSAYLSKNYLSSDKDKKKKKKKSKEQKPSTLVINDDLTSPAITTHETSTPTPTPDPPLEQQPKGWKVVGTGETITRPLEPETPTMASGAKAGLQTREQVAEQIKAKQQRDLERLQSESTRAGQDAETVYRDSTGQRVDMKTRLEERKRQREEEERERERKIRDMNMGLVQKLQLEQQRERLAKAKDTGLTRSVDDYEMNESLKKRDMEDDPMLSFNPEKTRKYVSLTGRKLYRGAYPENRFGIAPGHRWDGVDRSNGFEKAFFKKQVENERVKTLSYTMQEEY